MTAHRMQIVGGISLRCSCGYQPTRNDDIDIEDLMTLHLAFVQTLEPKPPTIEELQAENTRLQRELNEALRALRKATGCNWEKAIAARALPWVKRKTCEACNGRGEFPVDKWSAMSDVEPSRCEACKGQGEIYVSEPEPENPS